MSFITNIGSWVKGWKLGDFFKGLVDGDRKAAKQLQLTVEQSNQFVNKIREWLASPIGDLVAFVIPGDWGDKERAQAIEILTRFTSNNATLLSCMEQPTVGQQLICIYEKIQAVPDPTKKKSFLEELGTLATMVFADGKLDWSDAGLAAKLVFKMITQKKA